MPWDPFATCGLAGTAGAPPSRAWAPPMDVYETADRYIITAEVPGLAREQVDLVARGPAR